MKTKDEQSCIREELSDSPLLSSLYGRPDGYAPLAKNKQEAMVKTVLLGELTRKEQQGGVISHHIRWWAVAAGISLLIVVAVWRQQPAGPASPNDKGLASISDEELETYLEDNLHAFDLALLLETGLIEVEDAPGTAPRRSAASAKVGKISPPEHSDDDTL
jgi:hypothetical protein